MAAKKGSAEEAPVKVPKSLGACADLYADLRDERLAEEKTAAATERKEKFVKGHLVRELSRADGLDRGAVGKHHRVHVEVDSEPQVEDWDRFYAHLKKTGDFALLNRALNAAHVREVWASGKKVPGVVAVPVTKLRLHKI